MIRHRMKNLYLKNKYESNCWSYHKNKKNVLLNSFVKLKKHNLILKHKVTTKKNWKTTKSLYSDASGKLSNSI